MIILFTVITLGIYIYLGRNPGTWSFTGHFVKKTLSCLCQSRLKKYKGCFY